ncbi:MAG: hydroxymethylglutaryl-CoA reductase, degradative [Pseudomonadota bacterium]
MSHSRFPGFYRMSVDERVAAMRERGLINDGDFAALSRGDHTLNLSGADKMIENVIGVMGLPVGLGLNFLINGRDYVVPVVVEEPSIVAALSSAAKLARASGGFEAESTDPILIGQVQLVDVPKPGRAKARLLERKNELLNIANSLHPNMVARGGGAVDIEVLQHTTGSAVGDLLVVHLLVNTCDAMGANLVNTMCEGVAPLVEEITGGKVFLRILSNLTDRAMVRARCAIRVEQLAGKKFDGEAVRDGIVVASEFARVDPYRAATHNKGVMNGIDAVALATGNDWRAIEAGAHAYAARGHGYTSLTRWSVDGEGRLVGDIEIPIKVGTVGGPLQSNPTVALNLRLLGVERATELAEVMGAVGLAQNFSALRALATDGIQKGHMTLHARTVAMAAGATPDIFDTVVERLIESQEIKVWKARDLVSEARKQADSVEPERPVTGPLGNGHGKVIVLGEHAVVYGRHAIAAPVPMAIQARVRETTVNGVVISIARWDVRYTLTRDPGKQRGFEKPAAMILDRLGLADRDLSIEVFPGLPRAMGLGGSAALAVAIIRALDDKFNLGLDDHAVNQLAFDSEKMAHGTPSGVDNTVATYGQTLLFRKDDPPHVEPIELDAPLPLVIGMTGVESLTAKTVATVREAWQRHPKQYERLFDEIDTVTLQGRDAMLNADWAQLGEMMNICQGLLNALQVSCWELEEMVQIARRHGALGAKLTGGGGGGSMIALCPENAKGVMQAMQDAGYQAMEVCLGQS